MGSSAKPRRSVAAACAAICVLGSVLAQSAGAHGRPAPRRSAAGHRSRTVARPADPVASGIGPCPDTTLMPSASDEPRIVRSTLCLINAQRRHFGLVPLVEDTRLDHAAQAH